MGGTDASGKMDMGNAIVGVLVVLAIVIMVRHMITRKRHTHRELSEGLERNGWIVYTRTGCHFCDKQKQLLGKKFVDRAGNVIDCSNPPTLVSRATPVTLSPPQCSDPRVAGVPFWFNKLTGESKAGLQDASQLRAMAAH